MTRDEILALDDDALAAVVRARLDGACSLAEVLGWIAARDLHEHYIEALMDTTDCRSARGLCWIWALLAATPEQAYRAALLVVEID